MLMRIFALGIATVAFGSIALVDASAAEPQQGPAESQQGPARPIGPEVCAEQLSFDAFQDACNNPEANGWQIRPPQINVTCTKRELVWVPSRPTMEMRLPTLIDIDVSLGGKKKCVDDRASYQSESVEVATCFQFDQVERTYSRTIQATCIDLLKYNSAVELCDMTLKGTAGWALVAHEKTNLTLNSCTGQGEISITQGPTQEEGPIDQGVQISEQPGKGVQISEQPGKGVQFSGEPFKGK